MSQNLKIKIVYVKNLVFKSEKYSLSSDCVSHNFQKFKQNDTLCDIDLVCGDTMIKAHRVILAAASVFFETMFTSGDEKCHKSRVSLPCIASSVLPLVIEFIYTGQTVICSYTVQHLIDAADALQLEELSACCAEYLRTQFHPSNVLGIFSFAEAHNFTEVAKEALDYAEKRWKVVAEEDEIVKVPLALLIELLSSDNLVIDNEEQVLYAALRWLDHDPISRKRHCVEVLQQVRVRALPPRALKNALTVVDPSIAEILHVFNAVLEWDINTKSRRNNENYFYVVGGRDRRSSKSTENFATAVRFDIRTEVWQEIASMSTPRSMLGVAALGGLLYAVGGENNNKALASAEVYDPITNSWTTIASMQRARRCFGLAAVNNKLYAFGGLGYTMESSIEMYDPVTEEWTMVGEMPEPRSHMSVVSYDGVVYMVGGRTQTQEYTSDVLQYRPACGEWRRLGGLLQGRAAAAAAVLGASLYVFGGDTDEAFATNVMDCYDLQSGQLNFVGEMMEARIGCVACALGDSIIVAGGDCVPLNDDSTMHTVEMYDLDQRKWRAGTAMPHPRVHAGADLL